MEAALINNPDPVTDKEKHAWCRKRTGSCATILPPVLYDRMENENHDMRWFVKSKPVPREVT